MLINFGYFEGDGNALELDSYDYYTTLDITKNTDLYILKG